MNLEQRKTLRAAGALLADAWASIEAERAAERSRLNNLPGKGEKEWPAAQALADSVDRLDDILGHLNAAREGLEQLTAV